MYDKQDCCVIASTGFGKSLIYQYPAVFLDKLTVVVSPLIALMQDQVLSLTKKGIKACFFGSQQLDKTLRMVNQNVVYITPEFYVMSYLCKVLLEEAKYKIIMFAVDEAHVLDQWGNSFRPDYLAISKLRTDFPSVPMIALTATAPEYVKDNIVDVLRLKDYYFVKTALDRPNLEFLVKRKGNGPMHDLLPHLRAVKTGSAIVYVLSRKLAEEISESLNRSGIVSQPYHSTIKREIKSKIVEDFRDGSLRFIVCTIAFGMGVDKADVRLVLHYGLPKSVEAYYQEAGRAGRDGKPSKCILFWDEGDFETHEGFISGIFDGGSRKKVEKTDEQKEIERALLRRMANFVQSNSCRRLHMLMYLGTTDEELQKITIRNNCCDNCLMHLFYNVPLQLQYQHLDDNGKCNFTQESKKVFKALNKKLMRSEIVDVLTGVPPSRQTFRYFNMEAFGVGSNQCKEWWLSLIGMLISNLFLEVVGNTLRLSPQGQNYIKKGLTIKMTPSSQMLEYMAKREDIELYWESENFRVRPTKSHTIEIKNDKLAVNDGNRVVYQVPDEDLQNSEEGSDSDDEELNLQLIEAANKAESDNRSEHEQIEVRRLQELNFDEDEEELTARLSQKRKLSEEKVKIFGKVQKKS